MSRLAGLCVGAVLATAPLLDGGREAGALAVHHSLLCLTLITGLLRFGNALERHRYVMLLGAGFMLLALWRSPCRYTTLLVLADLAAALAVFALTSAACEERVGARAVAIGFGLGAATSLGLGVLEALAGKPVHGGFANPHHAASLVTAAGTALIAFALGSRRWWKWIPLVLAALVGYIVLLESRGALLALAAGLGATLLLRRRFRLIGALALLLAGVVLSPNALGEKLRAGRSRDLYALDRVRIWTSGLAMARDALLDGGVGLGAFSRVAPRYAFPVEAAPVRHAKLANVAHNEYLELLAEASLPGLLLLVGPLWVAAQRLWRLTRKRATSLDRPIAAGAALAALSVHALVESVFHSPALLYVLAAACGVVAAAELRDPIPRPWSVRGRRFAVLVIVSAWVGGVWLPWAGYRAYQRFVREASGEALREALLWQPSQPNYHAAAAQLLAEPFFAVFDLPALAAAELEWSRAIQLDPQQVLYRIRRAELLHRAFVERIPARELAERAYRDYEAARRLSPYNAYLLFSQAQLRHALGDADASRALLEQALELEPSFRRAWRMLADIDARPETRERASGALERIENLRLRHLPSGAYEALILDLAPRP